MPYLVHRETGERVPVTDEEIESALASGEFLPPERVTVVDQGGNVGTIDADRLDYIEDTGGGMVSSDDEASLRDQATRERQAEGFLGGTLALAEGALDTATFGGYSAGARLLDDEYAREIAARREVHPGKAMIGEVGGAIATGGAGLAKTPAGAMVKGAERLSKTVGGYTGAAVRYGAEGAAFGFGTGVREVALQDDPVTLEGALSTIGTDILLGAPIGAAGGVLGKAAGKAIKRARATLKASRETRQAAEGVGDRISQRAAEYTNQRRDVLMVAKEKPLEVADDALIGGRSSQTRRLLQGRKQIQEVLDEGGESLRRNPRRLQSAMNKERTALLELAAEVENRGMDAVLDSRHADDAAKAKLIRDHFSKTGKKGEPRKSLSTGGATKFPEMQEAGFTRLYRDLYGKPGKKAIKLDREDWLRFADELETGAVMRGRRTKALGDLPDLIEKNQAILDEIDVAIDQLDAIKAGKSTKFHDKVAGAAKGYMAANVVGFVPGGILGLGAAAVAPKILDKIHGMIVPRLGKAGSAAQDTLEQSLDRLLEKGGKASKMIGPTSSRALARVRYGDILRPESDQPALAPRAKRGEPALLANFRARSEELLSQVGVQGGAIRMTPAARERVYEQLEPVRLLNIELADKIESHVARRVEFLARVMPKRPDAAGPQWRPSDTQLREFARYVQVVEEPMTVLARARAGTITSQDVEALREVYPAVYSRVQQEALMQTAKLRDKLTSQQRIAMSMLTGTPIDPALHPAILAQLQASFTFEPGTAGGTQAPAPQPQFGSVSKPNPTPAQDRSSPETRI